VNIETLGTINSQVTIKPLCARKAAFFITTLIVLAVMFMLCHGECSAQPIPVLGPVIKNIFDALNKVGVRIDTLTVRIDAAISAP
jgi:hypothetical protein